jgi:hypothetical protein
MLYTLSRLQLSGTMGGRAEQCTARVDDWLLTLLQRDCAVCTDNWPDMATWWTEPT